MTNYWLIKCEPCAYSIDDLEKDKKTCWEGVRNYQARNFLRDDMKIGDYAFYYHSNAKPSGIVGLVKIVKEGYPVHHALEKEHRYYDPKASASKPIWYMVDIEHQKSFDKIITLSDLREVKGLEEMVLLRKGSRLSIQPVNKQEFDLIKKHFKLKF